jgi:DtxR family Mn-dependent transcriptional regulator
MPRRRPILKNHVADRPSPTIEDYLQTIYSLETEGERVISARLARWLNVTPPTAWATVHRMQRDGMIEIDPKKTIHLTRRGRELAESVARRHRLSERFLTDALGLGWAEAHEQAHHFEHGMTPVIEQRIMAMLNHPMTCPHGSPIPGTGAKLSPDLVPLESLDAGDEATVEFISEELEEDLEVLRYLERHAIKPGKPIRVAERVPSMGVMLLAIDAGSVSLGLPVARRIRVRPGKRAKRST